MECLMIQANNYVFGAKLDKIVITNLSNKFNIELESKDLLSNLTIPESDKVIIEIEGNILKVMFYKLATLVSDIKMTYNKIKLV